MAAAGLHRLFLWIAHQSERAGLAQLRDASDRLLVRVELLEHDHRKIDVVFLESEDRRWIVHQHVGVEHEQPALHRGFCRLAAGGALAGAHRDLAASNTSAA